MNMILNQYEGISFMNIIYFLKNLFYLGIVKKNWAKKTLPSFDMVKEGDVKHD
jgi:hypothetical protein